eukprot:TRINITY_DN17415_c0_g1_i1.p1 TRINITY_DN17415_c0_g1~~TRINITY_DN17415_c0_g1_i1.p1  ORF type:complete len:623 (-),score=88.61 TRINITY_DN17415_c0_g1_i1:76-1944(-)
MQRPPLPTFCCVREPTDDGHGNAQTHSLPPASLANSLVYSASAPESALLRQVSALLDRAFEAELRDTEMRHDTMRAELLRVLERQIEASLLGAELPETNGNDDAALHHGKPDVVDVDSSFSQRRPELTDDLCVQIAKETDVAAIRLELSDKPDWRDVTASREGTPRREVTAGSKHSSSRGDEAIEEACNEDGDCEQDDDAENNGGQKGQSQRLTRRVSMISEKFTDESEKEKIWVKSPWFESLFCVLILLNTLIMALEVHYNGLRLGYEIGYPKFNQADPWQGADVIFEIAEWMFGIIFTLELLLKAAFLKLDFFREMWNWFDSVIIICWMIDTGMDGALQIDPMLMRLARLGRLMRLVRLVRKVQAFDALYVITTALRGSLSVLVWAFLLISLVLLMNAFFLNSILFGYMQDDLKTLEDRHKIFELFGTTSRSMLTMFELTVGNWVPVARIMQEKLGEFWVLYSIGHKASIGFAVIGVVNGVFMQETLKVSQNDDTIQIRNAERKSRNHASKMAKLFQLGDSSGDGILSRDEFAQVFGQPKVQAWLAAQELHIHDPDILFDMIDDGSGEISVETFVKGVGNLKGPARSMDLAHVLEEIKALKEAVDSLTSCPETKADERAP